MVTATPGIREVKSPRQPTASVPSVVALISYAQAPRPHRRGRARYRRTHQAHARTQRRRRSGRSSARGDAALKAVAAQPPDLIILDLNLPVLSGTRSLPHPARSRADARHLPIIMLTARTTENDRVTGLELGADDYVTKPFSLRELTARVRAVLRRSASGGRAAAPHRRTAATHLTADFDAVAVAVDGESVRLTRREFELLRYLVQNKNRVVSRDRLLERVWGYDRLVETRSVDVHVGRLRSKLRRRRAARSKRWSASATGSSTELRSLASPIPCKLRRLDARTRSAARPGASPDSGRVAAVSSPPRSRISQPGRPAGQWNNVAT